MPATMIFVLARALQQNVNGDKLIKSKPTLQAPHLRCSLSKNGPVRFGSKDGFLSNFAQESIVV